MSCSQISTTSLTFFSSLCILFASQFEITFYNQKDATNVKWHMELVRAWRGMTEVRIFVKVRKKTVVLKYFQNFQIFIHINHL